MLVAGLFLFQILADCFLLSIYICFAGVNSDETVDVTYVDFGNSEKLPFSDIRKLPDMFLRLPKQVIKY